MLIVSGSIQERKDSSGVMVQVSAAKPRDRGIESHTGHDDDSSHDTSNDWFEEMDSKVV